MTAERYQAYPEYKDSGVKWLGVIPFKWVTTRIKFESCVKARVGWHGLKSDDFTDEGPYLVTGSDFKGPRIDWNQCYHCDLKRYEQDPYIQLQNGDLLITKDGTIGKVAIVDNLKEKATLNSGVFVIRPLSGSYDSKFYFWLLQSNVFFGFVDFKKTGSTISHLYQDTFENFTFAMPYVSEQQQIAAFLDHETAKIDTLIQKQQKLIALLKEKRQAVISHAVTKGLNPDAPMKDSGVEWLGEVPEHWNIQSIKHIVSTPLTDGPHETPEFLDDGVPFVSAEAISSGKIDFSKIRGYISKEDHFRFSQKYSPRLHDVYMVKSGATTGVTAIVENNTNFNIWSPLAVVRCGVKAHPYFVLNFMRSRNYQEAVTLYWSFGTQQNIGMGVIENLSIAVPPISEQHIIANFLDHETAKIDTLIEKTQHSIDLSKERRTALISAAVTGKIDVRNWQPPPTHKESQ